MSLTRRDLLRTVPAAAIGASLNAGVVSAIDPIKRVGQSRMKLSLAAYSFRQWLDLKKPTMSLIDFIDLAATYPLDAVELTAYYFKETTPEYLAKVKGHCTRNGLDVSGTAVGNNFCLTDAAKHKEQIDMVKKWAEYTSVLGGKTVRIFGGNVKKGENEEAARKQVIAAIEECCEHAGKYGVYLALENHGGITATAEQMIALVTGVKSEWFGLNFDSGNFHTVDVYGDLAKVAKYAIVAQIKTEISAEGKKKEESDLAKVIQILRDANFRGHVALEYEAAEDAKVAVPRHLAALRKLVS